MLGLTLHRTIRHATTALILIALIVLTLWLGFGRSRALAVDPEPFPRHPIATLAYGGDHGCSPPC